jgi:hypothetical protein
MDRLRKSVGVVVSDEITLRWRQTVTSVGRAKVAFKLWTDERVECRTLNSRRERLVKSNAVLERIVAFNQARVAVSLLRSRKDQKFPLELISPWFTPSKKPTEAMGIVSNVVNPNPRCNYPPKKSFVPTIHPYESPTAFEALLGSVSICNLDNSVKRQAGACWTTGSQAEPRNKLIRLLNYINV